MKEIHAFAEDADGSKLEATIEGRRRRDRWSGRFDRRDGRSFVVVRRGRFLGRLCFGDENDVVDDTCRRRSRARPLFQPKLGPARKEKSS